MSPGLSDFFVLQLTRGTCLKLGLVSGSLRKFVNERGSERG